MPPILCNIKLGKEHDHTSIPDIALMVGTCENSNLFAGAERLLLHLHKHKVPICLATSSDAYNFGLKTTHHTELFAIFHHKVTGELTALHHTQYQLWFVSSRCHSTKNTLVSQLPGAVSNACAMFAALS